MKHLIKFRRNALNTLIVYFIFLTTLIISTPSCNNKSADTKDTIQSNTFDSISVKDKDKRFLADAAEINLEEIKLGKLAQQNSMEPNVKDLGKMMETEHTKCLNDLKTLAEKKSIILPTLVSKEGEEAYEKLQNVSGSEFDKKYCDMMVNGHKNAISEFEKAVEDSNDPDIRAWASETLPSLQRHLDFALSCQKKCQKYN